MPGREHIGSQTSRYGFQGQEFDPEVKPGDKNSVFFKYRMHDPRVGRFFAVDPLTAKYPHYTPYSFSGNKLISAIELEGLEEWELNSSNEGNGTNGEGSTQGYDFTKDQQSATVPSGPISENTQSDLNLKPSARQEFNIPPLADESDFVEYSGNCNDAARATCRNVGVYPDGSHKSIHVFRAGTKNNSTDNLNKALDYIDSQLEQGRVVMVGIGRVREINNRRNVGNNTNKNTAHFTVIVGRGMEDDGEKYYMYYDNAGGPYGTNVKVNRYKYDEVYSKLKKVMYPVLRKGQAIVTEVRPNIE